MRRPETEVFKACQSEREGQSAEPGMGLQYCWGAACIRPVRRRRVEQMLAKDMSKNIIAGSDTYFGQQQTLNTALPGRGQPSRRYIVLPLATYCRKLNPVNQEHTDLEIDAMYHWLKPLTCIVFGMSSQPRSGGLCGSDTASGLIRQDSREGAEELSAMCAEAARHSRGCFIECGQSGWI
jgi:hypothetical protein